MKDHQGKCFKCGSSPTDNTEHTIFRFPKPGSTNSPRCECENGQNIVQTNHGPIKTFSLNCILNMECYVIGILRKQCLWTSHQRIDDVEDITVPFLQVEVREPVAGPWQPLSDITNIMFDV